MGPPRLARSRQEVEEFIARQIDRAEQIHDEATNVTDDDSYTRWTHDAERWDALTAEGLRAM